MDTKAVDASAEVSYHIINIYLYVYIYIYIF